MPRELQKTASDKDATSCSIRGEYERHGAEFYYQENGADYRNPHEPVVVRTLDDAVLRWKPDLSHVLDLAAGSGEVTLVLRKLGAKRIDAIDPFTRAAYQARTGASAEPLTFADVAAGALSSRRYSLVVCSFALHLCPKSRLPVVAQQLAMIAGALLIITPHKRPVIQPAWGWKIVGETVIERVRSRYYLSEE